MKIRHESPHADMDWKVHAPLMLETPNGGCVHIERWSLAGLVWPDDAPECPKTGTLGVPFQGVDVRFPVRLAPCDESGLICLEGLSGRQRETLALFYRSLLSGRMASSADVITALDTPIDLVPMEQTEAEKTEQPGTFLPRPLRIALNVATYLLLATLVAGVIGKNIFANLDRIDIQHGRVVGSAGQAAPLPGISDLIGGQLTAGWVSESFAETLYIGMPATIGFNEDGAKITLNGVIADLRARNDPEQPGEFGIIVTIAADDPGADATQTLSRRGAPVNLEAKRQMGQRLRSWLSGGD